MTAARVAMLSIALVGCGRLGLDEGELGDGGADPPGSSHGATGGSGRSGPATGFARCTAGTAGGSELANTYSLGVQPTGPRGIASGDFNGDGHADLAIVDGDHDKVFVLIGNGNGQFTSGASPATGTGTDARAIITADLDGDGRLDLVTANSALGNVSVLLGAAGGGFGTARRFATGKTPVALAVGDFDEDGHPDLAVSAFDANAVDILRGDGKGGLAAAVAHAVAVQPYGMVVADFNRDGHQDIAVACQSGEIDILLGDGKGGFTAGAPAVTGLSLDQPEGVAVADLDGDGRLDLISANSSGSAMIMLGTASGFASPVTVQGNQCSGAMIPLLADFNCDGIPDLALPESNGSEVCVFYGTGAGPTSFVMPEHDFVADVYPESAVIGDFNGDGRPDIATANYLGADAAVLLGPFR